jgi:hypothetical protein
MQSIQNEEPDSRLEQVRNSWLLRPQHGFKYKKG